MSFLPQWAFRVFGKPSKDVLPFGEKLQKLYDENDYDGILVLSRELVKGAKELDSDWRLENKHLLFLLSDMARKLSESPEHVGNATFISSQIIDIVQSQEELHHTSAEGELQEARNEAKEFLLETADKLETMDGEADHEQKFKIYAYLAEQTLDGAFPARDSIPDWKKLCNQMMASAAAKDILRVAKILSRFELKNTKGQEEYSFPLFLDHHFSNLVTMAEKDMFPEHTLATMALSANLPFRWDCKVRDVLKARLEERTSKAAFDDCVGWAIQISELKADSPTAAFIIEKVLEGVQNPELVPDRKAFEKQKRSMYPVYGALSDALANLRREEEAIQSPYPTKAVVMHFLKTRGVKTLHQ